ncbi:hypothetical protein LX15_003337 [Streptoalloteichus tenebrarius]|uniref:Metalloprotease n=1 Tax=Streptoalloteichus tenebrarius (strain ATCC 17920 / DSM 40477 / JCM 4838 / CBS 697.72 / NBRC 16177 / NCIMB 11028 / NRRL B-12390 / A12253. 1 / ISP 5477) TaxID=1933 RepID=A0ABT1HVT8_STRSD|nr:neutral zinc metallopeptidase [Streptoalloteichus tenebrarius]MCP2259632.1 hypothetical protein [Streptoalloteichus tenebrarius]BFF00961.1 hypothetical protein GCM10020241_26360 [Streptoalloteichus tenebrarius]
MPPPAGARPVPTHPGFATAPTVRIPRTAPPAGSPPGLVPAAPPGLGQAAARQSPATPLLALALIVVSVLGIGVIGLLAVSTSTRTAEPGYDRYPTHTPTPGPSATTTGASPTTTHTGRTSTGTTATSTTPAEPKPVHRTGDNPLSAQGISTGQVTCQLPRFSPDPAGQDAFYRAALPCLEAAWAPAFRAAGLPLKPVELRTITGSVKTPCGNLTQEDTAYYCDGVIYMTALYYSQREKLGNRAGKYLAVLAHEYGHHVQESSGILKAGWDRMYEVGPETPAGLELSRRKELQATCFGAMFIAAVGGKGSVDRTMVNDAVQDFGDRGDWPNNGKPRDHGRPEVNKAWANQGLRTNSTAQCNTWVATPDSVS